MDSEKQPRQEEALRSLFQQMRSDDRAMAPEAPTEARLLSREQEISAPVFASTSWKVAVAASVVAVTALLISPQTPDDPGALYLDIMSANAISTDSLLEVSIGTLPEMVDMPGVLDPMPTVRGASEFN